MSIKSSSNERMSSATSTSTLSKEFSLSSIKSAADTLDNFSDSGYYCKGPEHFETLVQQMQTYWQSSQLCDVSLIAGCDGKKISAHRVVLASASPYFAAMFTGSLREVNEEEITLHKVDGDSLFQLIQYCYTGQIELREETVERILANSCLLQLNAVSTAACNFLARQLHPSNCLGFALFAEQQGCQSLLNMAQAYTCQNFMQVSRNQEFFDLSKDQLSDLLKSEDLNIPSEQEVFFALTSWIQHDPKNRQKYLGELLGLIKLPLLEPSFIVDHIESLGEGNDCQRLIMEAMKWHLLPERRSQIISSRTRPRKSTMGKLLAIGGMDGHKGPLAIESYDPRLNEWTILKEMQARRLQCGVAVMDNAKLIIVGGRDGLKTLNTVECLNLSTMTWSTLPQMNTHRHGLGVAVLNGPLYAVGGHDGWSFLNTVERYDPVAKQWTFVAPMSALRSTAGVAVLDGRLYVVGGRDGSVCHRSVECFDPHTNKWTNKAQMNKRRGGVGVTVCNGFLYALGGHDCPANNPAACRTETVERYDPATDTWTLIASLSIGRDGIGVSILGDTIIAVGGYDGNQYLRVVEKYDAENNEWIQLTPCNYLRAGACVAAIPNLYSATVTNVISTSTINLAPLPASTSNHNIVTSTTPSPTIN